ncbi:hypothetical protein AVEN_144566-1 [Araneus ventricosus]|uniref:Helitron helicase-like domain-containing protein n=1 Tax=Araneus ventricosus TaxID=182803 RepID=A0A4Y2SLV3_ARAVE|nr:hypothetical protein AVEN_144566-1 [Araneus ventricosus]
MLQHARERRLNVIKGQNHHQIQTFYAARTVLYPIVEEHNCGEMDNLCLKCGGLYFRDEKNTRGIYTHCCHNGNIIEQASVYPVEMKGLMDGSDELSVHFKNNIRSFQWVHRLYRLQGEERIASEFMAKFITGLLIYTQLKQEMKTLIQHTSAIL